MPKVRQELLQLPYRHIEFLVFARVLDDSIPDIRSKISLEIKQFGFSDLESVRRVNRPSEANLCARRLAAGHMGLIAFHNSRLAGYAWGCGEIDPKIESVRPNLDPGDVLCVDAFTPQAFRNQGVQTALTLARFRMFREQGFLRAVSFIDTSNHPSLAVWKKLEARIVSNLDFKRIGIWCKARHL